MKLETSATTVKEQFWWSDYLIETPPSRSYQWRYCQFVVAVISFRQHRPLQCFLTTRRRRTELGESYRASNTWSFCKFLNVQGNLGALRITAKHLHMLLCTKFITITHDKSPREIGCFILSPLLASLSQMLPLFV